MLSQAILTSPTGAKATPTVKVNQVSSSRTEAFPQSGVGAFRLSHEQLTEEVREHVIELSEIRQMELRRVGKTEMADEMARLTALLVAGRKNVKEKA